MKVRSTRAHVLEYFLRSEGFPPGPQQRDPPERETKAADCDSPPGFRYISEL